MDITERLEAIDEISRLKARYFRCVDTHDWEAFITLWAHDAVMDMSDEFREFAKRHRDALVDDVPDAGSQQLSDGVSHGPAEITAFVQGVAGRMQSVHHGHTPEIELTSGTTATGVWPMEDRMWWSGADGRPHHLHGYGHYHETYVKEHGRWLIARTRLTRLRVDVD